MITIGLDFGTHQTKICVENSANPNQKFYEFIEFEDSFNNKSFYFPSVVQINRDHKLSYGFVNEDDCLTINYTDPKNIVGFEKPVLKLNSNPILIEIPPKPNAINYPAEPLKRALPPKPQLSEKSTIDWKDQLAALKFKMEDKSNALIIEWQKECEIIRSENKRAIKKWEIQKKETEKKYRDLISNWDKKCLKIEKQNEELIRINNETNKRLIKEHEEIYIAYNQRINRLNYLTIDESGLIIKEKLNYKHFKFALFSNEMEWYHENSAEIVSIWYLANILFLLRKKFGDDFFTQMGIPSGVDTTVYRQQINQAICVFLSAFNLVEYYKTHEKFLNATYEELKANTVIHNSYTNDDVDLVGILIMPEAFAGLRAITQNKRIEHGMNLLIDIGGGTTDIAFFRITENNLPDIHTVVSLHKGINFVFENLPHEIKLSDKQSITYDIHTLTKYKTYFDKSIDLYRSELVLKVRKILDEVKKSFRDRSNYHALNISQLTRALRNRPVIFTGGGATFEPFLLPIDNFSDVRRVQNRIMMNEIVFNSLRNPSEISILCTAYGLSIAATTEDIRLTEMDKLFDHILAIDSNNPIPDFEHGLTDY